MWRARRTDRGPSWDVVSATLAVAWMLLSGALEPGGAAAEPTSVPGAPETAARARFLMGTRLSIVIDGPVAGRAFDDAFDEVARLETVLSNWKATSELARLNARAARGDVLCSPDLYRAIRLSLEWAERTGGAFDPTVEPLVRALGLRPGDEIGGPAPPPRSEQASSEPPPIGWRHVRLGRSGRSVRFDADGVGIDLGGIGKGIALDAAARTLERDGVRDALLDFGGQILALGRPRGSGGWPVGIADPADRDEPVAVVTVAGLSVATSGNGERSVPGPDGPVGHILDPATRRPAPFDGSVTVAARDGTSADALSTALFVMGPERGREWAERRGIPALYLWRTRDGTLRHRATRAFDAQFREWSVSIEH